MSPHPQPAIRIYRRLLRAAWPRDLRRTHEREALETVTRLSAAARSQGRAALARYWIREFAALLHTAWTARRGPPRYPADYHAPGRTRPMTVVLQDLRYALRMLRRAPGFTAVVVLTFALGVGANAAIFSLVDGILLRPLPYAEPDRLLYMQHERLGHPDSTSGLSPGNVYDLQAAATLTQPMAGFSNLQHTITVHDEAERVLGVVSVGSVLEVLGAPPLLGRIFTAAEDRPDAPPVLVLSHGAWRRLFQEDPAAVGRTVLLNGETATIVGVMPAGFHPNPRVDLWRPARLDAEMRRSRTQFFLGVIARLAPGAHPDAAAAQLESVMAGLRRDHPQANGELRLGIQPLRDRYVGDVRPRLWILMASVFCVLLIACANIANLMLARATGRRHEVSVRQAIGAGRGRLIAQLLTEGLVLTALGGAAGVLVAVLFLNGLLAWLPPDTPRLAQAAIDWRVVVAVGVGSAVAGILVGLVPALQLSGEGPAAALREGSRGASGRSRLGSGLVVAELALAVVLLAGAGLLLRSFVALQRVDPGFRADKLLTFSVDVSGPACRDQQARRATFVQDALAQLAALPGVEAAAAGSIMPVAGRGTGAWFNRLDRPTAPGETPPAIPYRVVSPGYFPTLGIPLVRGRLLREGDGLQGTPSVVLSESAARRLWTEGDPIGARIYLGAPDERLFPEATVVGVVADVKQAGLDSESNEAVYGTMELMPWWPSFTFVLRASGDPAAHAAAARSIVRTLDPTLPVTAMQTMDDILETSVRPTRASMLLLTTFGAVALLLAAVGVFGVLSYAVSRRSRELGIRMVLGAEPAGILRLVLREGMREVAAGIGLGVVAAYWLTQWMATMLFDVPPRDPLTFGVVAILLGLVGALACYVPARRATRVNPLIVLQES